MNKSSQHSFLYEDVSQLILSMIDNGTLSPGDKVPSLRKLSTQLKVSIATVSQAYLKLEEQGVVRSRPQSGFYVSQLPSSVQTPTLPSPLDEPRKLHLGTSIPSILRDSRQPGVVSLGIANPATAYLPTKALARTIKRISSEQPDAIVSYAPSAGHEELRKQIAKRFTESGKAVSYDEVIITNGATEALMFSLQSVAKAGDVVAVATPSYFTTLQLIESMGILLVEIESDVNTGMSLASIEATLKRHDIKAVIASCNFANPTGSLMPEENKKRLVKMTAKHNIPIIEDDVYGELYFGDHKPGSCKSYDEHGLVLHCNSVSKTLAPGFRVGWIIAGQFKDSVLRKKQLSSLSVASLQQLVLADFLSKGQYDRLLSRSRRIYKQQVQAMRHAVACDFPTGTRISSPEGGFTLWVQLPRGLNTFSVYSRAIERGVSVTPGPLFSATGKYTNYLRLCAGIVWSTETREAIQVLGELISDMLAEKQRS